MSEPTESTDPQRLERFAQVRGEHGWARYVDDETLASWLWPAHPAAGEDDAVSR